MGLQLCKERYGGFPCVQFCQSHSSLEKGTGLGPCRFWIWGWPQSGPIAWFFHKLLSVIMQWSSYWVIGLLTAVATVRYVHEKYCTKTSEWLLPWRSVNSFPLPVLGNWHVSRNVTSGHGERKLNWQSVSVFSHGKSPNSGESFNF